jgi:DNA-binding HxlR family transcriptional regulator
MTEHRPDPYSSLCPSRDVIEVLGDKWSLLVLPLLISGPQRNGSLMRRIEGISQKMLTQTLKRLGEFGIIARIDHHEVPPRVEYALTPLGESLARLIERIDSWVVEHHEQLHKTRARGK